MSDREPFIYRCGECGRPAPCAEHQIAPAKAVITTKLPSPVRVEAIEGERPRGDLSFLLDPLPGDASKRPRRYLFALLGTLPGDPIILRLCPDLGALLELMLEEVQSRSEDDWPMRSFLHWTRQHSWHARVNDHITVAVAALEADS